MAADMQAGLEGEQWSLPGGEEHEPSCDTSEDRATAGRDAVVLGAVRMTLKSFPSLPLVSQDPHSAPPLVPSNISFPSCLLFKNL